MKQNRRSNWSKLLLKIVDGPGYIARTDSDGTIWKNYVTDLLDPASAGQSETENSFREMEARNSTHQNPLDSKISLSEVKKHIKTLK